MFPKSLHRILYVYMLAIISSKNCSPDEISLSLMNKLVGSSSLDKLKDDQVRTDNEINTSLVAVLGSNPNHWFVDQENFETASTVIFTALSCAYSKKVYYLIESGKILLEKWAAWWTKSDMELYEYVESVQTQLKTFKDFVRNSLTSMYHFAKKTKVAFDKIFMGTLLSVHLHLNNDGIYLDSFQYRVVDPPTHVRLVIDRLTLAYNYIINQAEAYTIERCYPPSFDSNELQFSTWATSVNVEDKFAMSEINKTGISLAVDVRTEERYLDELEIGDSSNDRDLFNVDKLLLSKLLDIELVSGKKLTSLRCMKVNWPYMYTTLEKGYLYVLADYHSDLIIKYQVLVMETIASVIFHLVSHILESTADHPQEHPGIKIENSLEALKFLESLNFPGQIEIAVNHINLYIQNEFTVKNILFVISRYFSSSTVSTKFIHELIISGNPEAYEYHLTSILFDFIKKIKQIRPDIDKLLETNINLCDYEYETSGFLQSKPGKRDFSKKNVNFTSFNCTGATTMIKHLVFSNYLLDQCKILAKDNYDSSSTERGTDNNINVCFNKIINYINNDTIEKNIMLFLEAIIDIYTHVKIIIPINRKLIESIYAFVLLLHSELTMPVKANDALVEKKIEDLSRSFLFIINLSVQFTIDHCQILSTKQWYEQVCTYQIDEACDKVVNDIFKKVECTGEIIDDNLKNIPIAIIILNKSVGFWQYLRSLKIQLLQKFHLTRETHEFNFQLLLMDVIIEKSSLLKNGFSMLQDIMTTWKGKSKSLIEVHDIVKQELNPKYLFRYQLLMIRAVAFIAYEKMKDVVVQIQISEGKLIEVDCLNLIDKKIDAILGSPYPDHIMEFFFTVYQFFYVFLENTKTFEYGNKIIEAINFEQSKLELYLKPPGESVTSLFNIDYKVDSEQTGSIMSIIDKNDSEIVSQISDSNNSSENTTVEILNNLNKNFSTDAPIISEPTAANQTETLPETADLISQNREDYSSELNNSSENTTIEILNKNFSTDVPITSESTAANQTEKLPEKTLIDRRTVEYIYRFIKYLENVMEVKVELKQVLNIIDWKKILDVSIN